MFKLILPAIILTQVIPPNPPPAPPSLNVKGGHGWVKWTSKYVDEVYITDLSGNILSTDLPSSSLNMPQNRMSWPAGNYVMVGNPTDPRRPQVYFYFTVN